MYAISNLEHLPKRDLYAALVRETAALLGDERDLIANAANFAALVWQQVPVLNWCGFYLLKPDGDLLVGPFQGKPACVRIALGRGVCGTAAVTRRTQLVQDVNDFPGHIACDAASRSEIVVPLQRGKGTLLGVWDVDSPVPARFDAEDQAGMEALCHVFMASID